MPRIRTVKPEFWLDEHLAMLPPETRLLAIGLLNQADDDGYFRAHPVLLKAAIFPFNEPSVSPHDMLIQLQKIGYISLCIGGDGKAYGLVVNFAKHQKINRPTPSKIKELWTFSDCSVSPHGELNDSSLPERKGKERNMEQGKEHEGQPSACVSDFEKLWLSFDQSLGDKGSKKKALEQFKKLKPDPELFTKILSAVVAQVENKRELSRRGVFVPAFQHVERWLKNERWNDELSTPTGNNNGQRISAADEALFSKYPHLRPQ